MDKNCARCGLPADNNIRPVEFDANGICDLCHWYEQLKSEMADFDRLEKLFLTHLDAHKGKYEYDCVIGFSGGKDSSYLAYMMKKKYGCKVLLVTVSFGFMPCGPAIENMKRISESLEIDHEIYDLSNKEIKSAFATLIKEEYNICGLCVLFTVEIPKKIANERHIPLVMMGTDRGQLFRYIGSQRVYDFWYKPMFLTEYSAEKTTLFHHEDEAKQTRQALQSLGIAEETAAELIPTPQKLPGTNCVPMLLHYFAFHPYKEDEMKRTLVEELGWQLPQGDHFHAHHDCALHDISYLTHREIHGGTLTALEICHDVREGAVSRETAIEVLKREKQRLDSLVNPYEFLEQEFDISEQEIIRARKRIRRKKFLGEFLGPILPTKKRRHLYW